MRISVAMCTYNGAEFLEEQVRSMAAQSRLPDELVVCDDRSTDSTVPLLRELERQMPFPIHIHVNDANLGSTRNFERAIGLCDGDVIALSDQDDVWMPQKLAVLESMFADPAVLAVFTDGEIVDEALEPLGYGLFDHVRFGAAERAQLAGEGGLTLFLSRCIATGAAMAFRRELRDVALPIPAGRKSMIHDRWIAICAAALSGLRHSDEKLIAYRQHAKQQIGAPSHDAAQSRVSLEDMRRRDRAHYREQLHDVRLVAERLGTLDRPQVRDTLQRWIRHLERRAALPGNRLARLPTVARELANGGYRDFSAGWSSSAKDLLRP